MVAASAIAHRDTKTTNDKPQPSLSLSLPLRRSLVIKEDMLSICYFCQHYDDDLMMTTFNFIYLVFGCMISYNMEFMMHEFTYTNMCVNS
jgi:hypothetical protein